MSDTTPLIPAVIAEGGRRTPIGTAPTEFCLDDDGDQTIFVLTAAYR